MADNLNPDGTIKKTDPNDLGVPMRPAPAGYVPSAGPEDALDPNPTRGDYRNRLGDKRPHSVEPDPNAAPGEPQVKVIDQSEHAENMVPPGVVSE